MYKPILMNLEVFPIFISSPPNLTLKIFFSKYPNIEGFQFREFRANQKWSISRKNTWSILKQKMKIFDFWAFQIKMYMPEESLAHAKIKKSFFSPKILEFIGDIGVILNDFWSRFYVAIKIWVKFILVENFKIPGIQPIHAIIWRHFRSHTFWGISCYKVIT